MNELDKAVKARAAGFPVAGIVGEIYEDALIYIPDQTKEGPKVCGRVLSIFDRNRENPNVLVFVVESLDGTQVTERYGRTFVCYFALPEDYEKILAGAYAVG